MISPEGEKHERIRANLIEQLSNLGGLQGVLLSFFAVAYYIFQEPFRDLHLAVSFNQLKNQIFR